MYNNPTRISICYAILEQKVSSGATNIVNFANADVITESMFSNSTVYERMVLMTKTTNFVVGSSSTNAILFRAGYSYKISSGGLSNKTEVTNFAVPYSIYAKYDT